MLSLPNVTLVLIETREHELAQLALEDCERAVNFGDVLVFTDRVSQFMRGDRRVIAAPDWPEKIGWSRCLWQDVPPHVTTSHILSIQWDAWVWDTSMWRNEYLDYDYIGAPWPWHKDGRNVGNGGFSLRTTALMRYVRKHRDKYPCVNAADDDLLCRQYRVQLEERGFRWAPVELAQEFAFECSRPSPESRHFGFHGAFNFPAVLTREQLIERARVMQRSRYIRANDRMWEGMIKNAPWLTEELAIVEAAE